MFDLDLFCMLSPLLLQHSTFVYPCHIQSKERKSLRTRQEGGEESKKESRAAASEGRGAISRGGMVASTYHQASPTVVPLSPSPSIAHHHQQQQGAAEGSLDDEGTTSRGSPASSPSNRHRPKLASVVPPVGSKLQSAASSITTTTASSTTTMEANGGGSSFLKPYISPLSSPSEAEEEEEDEEEEAEEDPIIQELRPLLSSVLHLDEATSPIMSSPISLSPSPDHPPTYSPSTYLNHQSTPINNNEQMTIVLVGGFLLPPRQDFHTMYWGEALNFQAYRIICVHPGPIASLHDRVCQIFYELKGGRCNYGKGHSEKFGHEVHGIEYPGTFPQWDENHPIHLIGHSFGGMTIRLLLHYLEKKAFVGHNTSPDWVRSMSTINSPHNGTHLVYGLGADPSHPPIVHWGSPGYLLGTLAHVTEYLDIHALRGGGMDFNLQYWNLSWRCGVFRGLLRVLKAILGLSNICTTADNAAYDMTLHAALSYNEMTTTYPGIFYFSFVGTHPKHRSRDPKQWALASIKNIAYRLMGWLVRKVQFQEHMIFDMLGPGHDPKAWCQDGESDGVVSVFSQAFPRVPEEAPHEFGLPEDPNELISGRWYVTELPVDHMGVVGYPHSVDYQGRFFEALYGLLEHVDARGDGGIIDTPTSNGTVNSVSGITSIRGAKKDFNWSALDIKRTERKMERRGSWVVARENSMCKCTHSAMSPADPDGILTPTTRMLRCEECRKGLRRVSSASFRREPVKQPSLFNKYTISLLLLWCLPLFSLLLSSFDYFLLSLIWTVSFTCLGHLSIFLLSKKQKHARPLAKALWGLSVVGLIHSIIAAGVGLLLLACFCSNSSSSTTTYQQAKQGEGGGSFSSSFAAYAVGGIGSYLPSTTSSQNSILHHLTQWINGHTQGGGGLHLLLSHQLLMSSAFYTVNLLGHLSKRLLQRNPVSLASQTLLLLMYTLTLHREWVWGVSSGSSSTTGRGGSGSSDIYTNRYSGANIDSGSGSGSSSLIEVMGGWLVSYLWGAAGSSASSTSSCSSNGSGSSNSNLIGTVTSSLMGGGAASPASSAAASSSSLDATHYLPLVLCLAFVGELHNGVFLIRDLLVLAGYLQAPPRDAHLLQAQDPWRLPPKGRQTKLAASIWISIWMTFFICQCFPIVYLFLLFTSRFMIVDLILMRNGFDIYSYLTASVFLAAAYLTLRRMAILSESFQLDFWKTHFA